MIRRAGLEAFLAFALIVSAIHCMAGCGGHAMRAARGSVDLSARTLAAADVATAEALHLADPAGRAADRAEYEAAIAKWRTLESALRNAHAALLVVEMTLDAGETPSLGCVGAALAELSRALEGAGVPVPEILLRAVNLIPKGCAP